MKAVKGNREYLIDESQKKGYQDAGFDIYDDTGSQIAYGRGKTVPYGDYISMKKENEGLKEKVSDLEGRLEVMKEESREKSKEKAAENKGTGKKAGE
ncbi:MAG: hypothetical protein Q4E24_14005 [bacterium]|nr:hypothetical protein [bacterium]